MGRRTARALVWWILALGSLALAAVACGGDEPTAPPVDYSQRGPYAVGEIDLQLDDDHQIAVFYPADPAAVGEDDPPYRYSGEEIFGAEFAALLPEAMGGEFAVPDTYVDLPVSGDGPFPVLLHSHGFSGQFRFAGYHNAHVASWGYLVASVDHPERGVVSILNEFLEIETAGGDGDEDLDELLDTRQLLEALDLLEVENSTPGSPLEGAVNTEQVAAEGHSAGGGATGAASHDPRIQAWIGQATGTTLTDPAADLEPYRGEDEEGEPTFDAERYRAENPPPDVASLVITAEGDSFVELDGVEAGFEWLAAPKRLAVIAGSGHAVFVDPCLAIQRAGGLATFVEQFGVDPDEVRIVALGEDGCLPEDEPADSVWPVIDHLTVAQLNWVFDIDGAAAEASLEESYLDDIFPGLLARYEVVD